MGRGFGAVGRAVAYSTKDPQIEPRHRFEQIYILKRWTILGLFLIYIRLFVARVKLHWKIYRPARNKLRLSDQKSKTLTTRPRPANIYFICLPTALQRWNLGRGLPVFLKLPCGQVLQESCSCIGWPKLRTNCYGSSKLSLFLHKVEKAIHLLIFLCYYHLNVFIIVIVNSTIEKVIKPSSSIVPFNYWFNYFNR